MVVYMKVYQFAKKNPKLITSKHWRPFKSPNNTLVSKSKKEPSEKNTQPNVTREKRIEN